MQDRERREIRARRRLGDWDAACVVCGESFPHCLELHHIAGRKYSPDTVPVCKNCHTKLTDEQLDYPNPAAQSDPVQLERIGRYLLGVAALLGMVAAVLAAYGYELIEAAARCPLPYGRLQAGGAA